MAFLLLSRCILLNSRGSCCSFGGFLLVLLALLDALFEFALAVGLLVNPQAKWVGSGTDLTLSPVTSSRWRLAVWPANPSAMITESTVKGSTSVVSVRIYNILIPLVEKSGACQGTLELAVAVTIHVATDPELCAAHVVLRLDRRC